MAKNVGWHNTLKAVLYNKSKYSTDGCKMISKATIQARREHLVRTFKDIRNELGYKIQNVRNLTGKHVIALAKYYAERVEEKSLSVSTFQNRFSHLRTFAKWIGKPDLVGPIERYTGKPFHRQTVARQSKTWQDNGVDAFERIKTIRSENERIGDALLLQRLFGLRTKESLLLRPHLADKETHLFVSHGTKGGRDRTVAITTDEQRALLNRLKSYIGKNESLVPKGVKYVNFRRKYYRLMNQHGISRQEGVTPHGLRHEHLNELYEKTTGHQSPVRGGKLRKIDKELDSFGRNVVAERAGHSREFIAGAYIGGRDGKE
jgi:integrase